MDDLRERLEAKHAALQPAPGGFERLIGRRRRREIRRRVTAGAVAAIVAIASFGAAFLATRNAPHVVPAISPSNVASLAPAWTGRVNGSPSAPVIGDGTVFVTADKLYAFPLSCGHTDASCAPTWTGDIGGASNEPPAVVDGIVVAVSGRGMTAYDAACGNAGEACTPLWTAPSPEGPASDSQGFSAPAVSDGYVYAAARRGLFVFAAHCRSDGGICQPAWHGPGSGATDPAAIGRNDVYVRSETKIQAYPLTCDTLTCAPLWSSPAPEGIGTPVAVAGDELFMEFGVYSASEGGGPRFDPTWVGGLAGPSADGPPIVRPTAAVESRGVVYVSSYRLYAYPLHCATGGRECPPIWTSQADFYPDFHLDPYRQFSQPTVGDGLIFVSTDRPYAYEVGCGTNAVECAPLWEGPSVFPGTPGRPAFSAEAVVVSCGDGRVIAFEPTAP
jgi:PQQ-like domain